MTEEHEGKIHNLHLIESGLCDSFLIYCQAKVQNQQGPSSKSKSQDPSPKVKDKTKSKGLRTSTLAYIKINLATHPPKTFQTLLELQ